MPQTTQFVALERPFVPTPLVTWNNPHVWTQQFESTQRSLKMMQKCWLAFKSWSHNRKAFNAPKITHFCPKMTNCATVCDPKQPKCVNTVTQKHMKVFVSNKNLMTSLDRLIQKPGGWTMGYHNLTIFQILLTDWQSFRDHCKAIARLRMVIWLVWLPWGIIF